MTSNASQTVDTVEKLNRITRKFRDDPELFDGECFNAPSLSSWDLD